MSQKGKEIVVGLFVGYRYRQDRRNADGSVSWRCLETNCAGRMKIFTDGQTQEITKHEHAPSDILVTITKTITITKKIFITITK